MRLELKYTLIMNTFILATMSALFVINDRVVRQENVQSVIDDYGKGAAMREIAGRLQEEIKGESNPEKLRDKIWNADYSDWAGVVGVEVQVVDVNVMNESGVMIASYQEKTLHDQLDDGGLAEVIGSQQTRVRYPPNSSHEWVVEYTVPYIYKTPVEGIEQVGAVQILFSATDIDRHSRWLRVQLLLYVGIATVVLTIFINPLTSYLIVRRLERLMETVTAAQAGDMAIRAKDSSHDEIGRLSSGFNRMMERISSEHASRLEALGTLAAGVAHEVRNPLHSITMTAQYLKGSIGDDADEDTTECLDVISQEVKVLERIVKQFLQLTLPVEMDWKVVDLNLFLVDVMRSHASSLEMANIRLKSDFSRELIYARIDPDKFRQAISNIVINAIQAIPDGGELSIITAWDTPQRTAIIEIGDTGVGVSQENIDRLFEPYFTTKSDGTGLGLAITYRIIEAHGGEITMESEEGKGTTFTILLHNIGNQNQVKNDETSDPGSR